MSTLHNINADVYDPEDVGLRDSPLLMQMSVNLCPSPSPEPLIPLPPVSPESSPDPEHRKTKTRPKYRPSPGDAVLISFLADGKHVDIARDAGEQPLASDNEIEESTRGVDDIIMMDKMEKVAEIEIEEIEDLMEEKEEEKEKEAEKETMDLTALAAGAVGILLETERTSSKPAQCSPPKIEEAKREVSKIREAMETVKASMPFINKVLYVDTRDTLSESMVKHEIVASPTEALPPMRQQSPKSAQSNGSSHITLPSISESIGDINRLPPVQSESPFAQSPPGMAPPRFGIVPNNGHGSPPELKSPGDSYRRELPSPGRSSFSSYYRRPSLIDGSQFSSPIDYSGSSVETPSTDQSGSTPATIAIDRMSIDGITNPQIGGYQCTYSACNAAPFQTQVFLTAYLSISP